MKNGHHLHGETGDRMVYIRPVDLLELPEEVRDTVVGVDHVYAVHNASGERLALVANRDLAFHLAREHDFAPVPVH